MEMVIDGVRVAAQDLHRCVLRFVQTPDGVQPVLYWDGKRVVKSWRVEMSCFVSADPSGGNANTGESC
jgi:hypothetical protein